jgi:hypothetical protein
MTRIRRVVAALATLAGALLAAIATAPAAFAIRVPPPGGATGPTRAAPLPQAPAVPASAPAAPAPSHVHTVIVGGMPGWQIALIAVGAALAAAVLAVLLDRAWAARKMHATTA